MNRHCEERSDKAIPLRVMASRFEPGAGPNWRSLFTSGLASLRSQRRGKAKSNASRAALAPSVLGTGGWAQKMTLSALI
jgi:hypothetical protein